MKKLVLGILALGLTTQINAQVIELTEVDVSVNYKYMDATNSEKAAVPVKLLKEKVLNYDCSSKESLYEDEYATHKVSFFIPEGKIVAAYDNDGKILRTIEKYKNVRLPLEVLESVAKKYPNWAVVEDVYLVKYHCDKGLVKNQYKIKLKKEDKIVNVKTDTKGNFI